jgi:adenine C2-methylase RlmN of 23S rRNA A2503 and tRNA A37
VTFRVARRERTIGSFDTFETEVFPGSVEKFLLELDDANAIEAILIGTFGKRVKMLLDLDRAIEVRAGRRISNRLPFLQKKIRYETCISTQVGCALDCRFCASSLVPFVRSLSAQEMLREVATLEYNIPPGGALSKVIFAGVGEPLMNYDAVSEVVRALRLRGIPSRINTIGVIPYLERLFDEALPCELIVSIHAPDDALRAELMPAGKGHALADLSRVLRRAPKDMLIEAKYLMLKGKNDSLDQARALADFVRDLPVMVTLQMYNRIEEREYEASPKETVLAFAAELRARGVEVGMLNSNIGEPVEGGCGQLRAHVVRDPASGRSEPSEPSEPSARKKRLAVIP